LFFLIEKNKTSERNIKKTKEKTSCFDLLSEKGDEEEEEGERGKPEPEYSKKGKKRKRTTNMAMEVTRSLPAKLIRVRR